MSAHRTRAAADLHIALGQESTTGQYLAQQEDIGICETGVLP
jgi:hypothetical protein